MGGGAQHGHMSVFPGMRCKVFPLEADAKGLIRHVNPKQAACRDRLFARAVLDTNAKLLTAGEP